ncbi:VWA domain-containing protein [Hydromonas duriensis]|uniref:TerF-like vWA domain-containing protein n=1 Tax=Hydromonas duriensis TaxID=1527608 RepID=A0A4V3DJH2_9BURK|nr:VWA domain-containing protein [Hydromonas duriensis]TDR27746.1 TerF-like vWA domain-containing protein [Hydromonas duriensis]
MNNIFEIEKEVEKVRFVLEKNGIDHVVRARVGVNLDVSGSMIELYKQGVVQKVVERILPLGLACDNNGEIDVWGFSNRAALACVATRENYKNIVEQEMMDGDLDHVLWEGTQYAPVIQANLDYYSGSESPVRNFFRKLFNKEFAEDSKLPVINYFLTDGENTDSKATQELFEYIKETESQIYYLLIGVGSAKYKFLRKMAEKFPNVGFVAVDSLKTFVTDENIYEQLLPNELCTWLKHEHDEEEDHH